MHTVIRSVNLLFWFFELNILAQTIRVGQILSILAAVISVFRGNR